ncbi:MAG: glycerate kinase, partial [Actinomycetota bacterium]|nr:glycerate kinase [Actinomycetota bacterium]
MSAPLRAVACPDSLKGVLAAREAAAALAAGFRRADVEAEPVPLADGGEGTAEALEAALGGEWRTAEVTDPLGRWIEARFLVLGDGRAVVESAEAIGLWRLRDDERDPIRASSRGLGELLLA